MDFLGSKIGDGYRPYIVAEISANHNGDYDRAMNLIMAAKWAGADAVKFQCYKAETITLDSRRPEFLVKRGPWKGRRLYELYKEGQTPWEWFPTMFEFAKIKEIGAFSSVFDPDGLAFLETIGCAAYKIASFDIVDTPLIRLVTKTGKPLVISTGMATREEISAADDAVPPDYPHCLLHCVSGYPTPVEEADLRCIDVLREYMVPIGLSDHTIGCDVPVAATAMGICLLEKHLTLARADGGPDADFSMEPDEFKDMVQRVHAMWTGCWDVSTKNSEATSKPYRKSLFVVEPVAAGEILTPAKVRPIRPAYGLPPAYLDAVVGRRAKHALPVGSPLSWDDLESA